MNNRDFVILIKIIQYTNEIEQTIVRLNLDKDSFADDFVAKNAISMCILQIGELVGKLSDEFKHKHSSVPWRDIKSMRNIAAHNYGEIDTDILWETAIGDIPSLRSYCQNLVNNI